MMIKDDLRNAQNTPCGLLASQERTEKLLEKIQTGEGIGPVSIWKKIGYPAECTPMDNQPLPSTYDRYIYIYTNISLSIYFYIYIVTLYIYIYIYVCRSNSPSNMFKGTF